MPKRGYVCPTLQGFWAQKSVPPCLTLLSSWRSLPQRAVGGTKGERPVLTVFSIHSPWTVILKADSGLSQPFFQPWWNVTIVEKHGSRIWWIWMCILEASLIPWYPGSVILKWWSQFLLGRALRASKGDNSLPGAWGHSFLTCGAGRFSTHFLVLTNIWGEGSLLSILQMRQWRNRAPAPTAGFPAGRERHVTSPSRAACFLLQYSDLVWRASWLSVQDNKREVPSQWPRDHADASR